MLKSVSDDDKRNIPNDSINNELMERLLMKDYTYHGKILLVEDEVPVRLFGVHALLNKGYEVIEAENGEMALEILETEGKNIRVVITDVVMPGMTGPEMAEKISIKYPHIKFIFTSGYAEDALSYLSENHHHFLAKPFTLNDLASKVKEVISSE